MRSLQPKNTKLEASTRIGAIVLSSLIIAVNLKSFVQAGDLFPGGFSGLTRLITRTALEYGGVELSFGLINLLLNIIPAAISFVAVGKRFTLYSCLSVVLVSVFTDLVPPIAITEDVLLVCVFGGIINGFAISLCLRARVTTGGTDFIAIALSEKKNVDAWGCILAANVVMLMVAGLMFGWEKALYSILFQYASTQVIRVLDPDSRRSTLLIVTGRESAGGVCAVIQDTNHSATLVEGVGLYNGEPCVMVYSVVESSQARSIGRKVRQADPNAFVNILPTQRLVGNFYRKPRD